MRPAATGQSQTAAADNIDSAKRLEVNDDEDGAPGKLARETSTDEIAQDLRQREKDQKRHEKGEDSKTGRSP